MITPAEIQNKDFSKSLRGYNEEEVDMFLDLITLDLEKLIKENINLKAQVATLEKEKGDIDGTDISIRETLETAKALMDDISASSEKRAQNLLRNAEADAAILIKDAKLQSERLKEESAELARNYKVFREEYKRMLERELSKMNDEPGIKLEESKEDQLSSIFGMNSSESVSEDDDRKTRINIKYE
ncbi:MAG: DivIVA domain-containing protein [Anaerovoracaceae bacterium]